MLGIPRLVVAAVAALVVLDVVGGLIAIATDLNDAEEAWGFDAELAVPAPFILVQVALVAVAFRGRGRFAFAAAVLLTAMCTVSVLAGLFDGDLFGSGKGPGQMAFGIILVFSMGFVGVLAALADARPPPDAPRARALDLTSRRQGRFRASL